MNNKFQPLSQDDVVCVTSGHILMPHPTFKVGEFITKMKQVLSLKDEHKEKWLGNGQVCQILQPGSSEWQKGKIRISLEFCPEEPRSLSLLDGIEHNRWMNSIANPYNFN